MRARHRRIGVLAGSLLVCATVAARLAIGATGDLSFQSCFADTAAGGCSVPADAALEGAFGVARSPGGDSIYVASQDDSSISHFTRRANGSLTYRGCFADTSAPGCSVPADPVLDRARGVAVSPDGDSVYVAAGASDDAISHLKRAAAGGLTYESCFADTAAGGCAVPANAALDGVQYLAVSPDGNSLYVTSFDDDSLSHFSRAGDGTLTYQGCFADTAADGCTVPTDPALDAPQGVAVSPDGDSVYVASGIDSSIGHFSRAADGSLVYQDCFAETAVAGCSVPSEPALAGAQFLAVSPDGDSVYVTSGVDDSISHFARADNGGLAYRSCFADTAADGCKVPADAALDGPQGISVSPGGDSVYVASSNENALSHFRRAADGELGFRGCLANTAASGCAVLGRAVLGGARATVLSPGGESLYLVSSSDSSLTHFLRERARCAGRPATLVGTPGPDLIRGTARRDRIAALSGNDTVRGLKRGDVLCGGRGRDRLFGGRGRDRLLGGPGPDLLRGGPGHDRLRGGPGRDRQIS